MPAVDPVPLIGHATLRRRLAAAVDRGSLPSSLLLHGQPGVGKQRLALWLAQHLLCTRPRTQQADSGVEGNAGCGTCQACRFAAALAHPDLHWVFPRPRPKDPDADAAELMRSYADAIAERVRAGLLYAPPGGTDAIFVSTVRALVHQAALTPSMGTRKVLVVGDAERMVPQEGAEAAANAFLKILEEPPSDTFIILTSSEPGALLPTIRSRVVAMRVAGLGDADVGRWVADPRVRSALDSVGVPAGDPARMRRAHGAPGVLLGGTHAPAMASAKALYAAAQSSVLADRYRTVLQHGATGARGDFAATLSALTELLHDRARVAVEARDATAARVAARAVATVEDARGRAEGNVNPQLLAARLMRDLTLDGGGEA